MVWHHGFTEESSPGRKDHYLHCTQKGTAGARVAWWAVSAALRNPSWGAQTGRNLRPPGSVRVLWLPSHHQLRFADAENELQEMQGLSVETLQESLRAGTASPHEHTGCGELPLGPRLAPGSAGAAHLTRQTQAAVSGGTCCPRPCPLSPPSFSPDDWALNPVYVEDSPRDALEEPGFPRPILIAHAVPRTKG